MRTKNPNGGRVRLSKLPPKPSAMAFNYLSPQPSDSEAHPDYSQSDTSVNESDMSSVNCVVPETCSDNEQYDDEATSTRGQRVVVPENSAGSGRQDIDGKDTSEMDWTEKKTCINCDEGGKLLVCSDSGCPISIHENCMRCSVQFDDRGMFYCPYCLYKRAIVGSCKARKKATLLKKALSVFLDKATINGDQKQQKAKTVEENKPNPSRMAVDTNLEDVEKNVLNQNQVHNHSIQMGGDQQEERSNSECNIKISNCKGAEISSVNHRNEENATINASDEPNIVVVEKTQGGPIIACGSGGACCREEVTGHEFEIAQIGKSLEPENVREDDAAAKKAEPLIAFPAEEAPDDQIHISTKRERNTVEILEENEGAMAEEEEVASSCGGDPELQVHMKVTDSFCGDTETVSPHKQKEKNVQQSQQVDCRRSSRNSSLKKKSAQKDNVKIAKTSMPRKVQEPSKRLKTPSFPSARRKKLRWTVEEEEMLEEGVQKFSLTSNKNVPWRKILEFGRHVFEGTRIPADLKDKWKNNLAKKYSAN